MCRWSSRAEFVAVVNVLERSKEIGVIRATGADHRDRVKFLAESGFLVCALLTCT
jgi:hypothetical protein